MRRLPARNLKKNSTLWLAQGFVTFFRSACRVWELFASPRNRVRLQELREKLDGVERERDSIFALHKSGRHFEVVEASLEMAARHGSPEDRARIEGQLGSLRAVRQQNQELKGIRVEAGENRAATVKGYRKYIQEHPDSDTAYRCLGDSLKAVRDFEGSLAAYQEAIRLADKPLSAAVTRLSMGQVLQEKGELAAAVSEYQSVIGEKGQGIITLHPLAYFHLGNALREQGNAAEAREAWKKAVKLDNTGVMAKKAREMLKNDYPNR